jgi:penicillin-insensitive murein endopeptidase
MRQWLSGLLCVAALGISQGASAAPASRGRTAILAEPRYAMGRSVGSPTDGHLVGGSHLDDTPYIRSLPMYAGTDDRWGLGSLVAMIDRSARAVRRQFPDAILSVGHLSQRGGGDIDRHASHESGRDADLSFYIRSQTNHALYSDQMISFRGDGTAPTWPGAVFDDAKNWALISAITQETHARVTYIFVAAPLRARLLAYAAHLGAPLATRNRAAELMVQPRGSLPHDDHFHVRIACPDGMTSCIELPTHPRPSRAMVAARAHHGSAAASSKLASATARHAPEPKEAPKVAPTAPPAPANELPEDDTSPTVTSAVLATPFDDVDGPAVPAPPVPSPRHREIQ